MLATVASGEALGALNGQGRWQDAMSKRASTHSPMIQSVVDRNRPSEGTYYRLMAEDGRLIPRPDQPAACCFGHIDVPPGVESGVFVIHYYTDPLKLDSEVRLVDDEPPPSLVVEGGAVIVSPMAWEERETAIQQRVERRDIENQRRSTLMNNLIQLTDVICKLNANSIERDHSLTKTLAAIADAQARLSEQQAKFAQHMASSTEAQSENLVKSTQAIGQALSTAKTDNLATVGSEIARQVGGIAQLLITNAAQARGGGGMVREARLRPADEPRALSAGKEAGKDGKAPKAPDDPPPPPASPTTAATATTTTATAASSLPGDVLIDWDEVCRVCVEPPLPAVPGSEVAPEVAPLVSAEVEPVGLHALGFPALAGDDLAALVEAPGLRDLFSALGLPMPPQRRTEPWSVAWAAREIKRRVFTLSESSIAWMLSSVENFVGFLRELGDIARPPEEALP